MLLIKGEEGQRLVSEAGGLLIETRTKERRMVTFIEREDSLH